MTTTVSKSPNPSGNHDRVERTDIIERLCRAISDGEAYTGWQADIARLSGLTRQRVNAIHKRASVV